MTNKSDWVMVPREPTEAMLRAAVAVVPTWDDPTSRNKWAAMIAAAPKPPTTPPDEMVENVARIIDPDAWAVMDRYLGEVLRLGKAPDPDNFSDKKSMTKARDVIAAITEGREG